MIDTSWSSIRIFIIIVLGVMWIYIFNHPPEEDDK